MKRITPHMIHWSTYQGEAGDLQLLLKGEYAGIVFTELYTPGSFCNISLRIAKWKIVQAINMLHTQHRID